MSIRQTDIAVVGAGGLGREISSAIKNDPSYKFLGFYDDNSNLKELVGMEFLGRLKDIPSGTHILFAIGNPVIKKRAISQLVSRNFSQPVFISSHANLEGPKSINLGSGTIICAGVQMTRDITIGNHVLINLNSTLGHDVKIGDYSSLMPGCHISGAVTIGDEVLVGSGAVILQGIEIGKCSKIGAGAVVTKDVPENSTVVGIPARLIS